MAVPLLLKGLRKGTDPRDFNKWVAEVLDDVNHRYCLQNNDEINRHPQGQMSVGENLPKLN